MLRKWMSLMEGVDDVVGLKHVSSFKTEDGEMDYEGATGENYHILLNGDKVGELTVQVSPRSVTVRNAVFYHHENTKRGLGRQVYQQLRALYPKHLMRSSNSTNTYNGGTFTGLSDAAQGLWKSFERDGKAERVTEPSGRFHYRMTESIAHDRLEAIARDLIDLNSDVLPDGLIDEFDGSTDDCLAVIERSYHSADCDIFAEVCEQITGDAPYQIRCGMQHHTVLSLSDHDGPFYDITGFVTVEEVIKRYGFLAKHTEVLEGVSHSWLDPEDDWHKDMVLDIIRYLKLIGRKPFDQFPV